VLGVSLKQPINASPKIPPLGYKTENKTSEQVLGIKFKIIYVSLAYHT